MSGRLQALPNKKRQRSGGCKLSLMIVGTVAPELHRKQVAAPCSHRSHACHRTFPLRCSNGMVPPWCFDPPQTPPLEAKWPPSDKHQISRIFHRKSAVFPYWLRFGGPLFVQTVGGNVTKANPNSSKCCYFTHCLHFGPWAIYYILGTPQSKQ